MPISRNGNDRSHTTGKSINASNANGQQRTNKMYHPTNKISAFIASHSSTFAPEVNRPVP